MPLFKKKILIRGIILFCLIAVFWTFFFLFRKNVEHQLAVIGTLKTRKQEYTKSQAGLPILKKEWEIARVYEAVLKTFAAPKKEELVSIPQKLKTLATRNGVSLIFTFGNDLGGGSESGLSQTTAPIASGTEIKFTALAEGSKLNVFLFLRQAVEAYPTLGMETIDMTHSEGSKIKVSIAGKISYQ